MTKDYSNIPSVVEVTNNTDEVATFRMLNATFPITLKPGDTIKFKTQNSEQMGYYTAINEEINKDVPEAADNIDWDLLTSGDPVTITFRPNPTKYINASKSIREYTGTGEIIISSLGYTKEGHTNADNLIGQRYVEDYVQLANITTTRAYSIGQDFTYLSDNTEIVNPDDFEGAGFYSGSDGSGGYDVFGYVGTELKLDFTEGFNMTPTYLIVTADDNTTVTADSDEKMKIWKKGFYDMILKVEPYTAE